VALPNDLRILHASFARLGVPRASPQTNTMTEEQQDQPKSYFPAPPQFFQQFTESNTSALEDARRSSVPGTPRVLELPPELRYLIPPAEPTDGKWRNYGDLYEVLNNVFLRVMRSDRTSFNLRCHPSKIKVLSASTRKPIRLRHPHYFKIFRRI